MRPIAAAFEHVEKSYSTGIFQRSAQPALRGVSLQIPTGKVFGLLGPNRAGKTTLIKLLLSLASPNQGKVIRLGEPARARRTLARVGYMHENHAFPRYLTARDVLLFYGGLSGLASEEITPRCNQLLERVGLADRANEPISRFSKGMVQRLGLAQALINDPELLVLDEPTEGLDLAGRQLLLDVVRERKATGHTVLLVSHSLFEVQELCDEIAVLVSGQLVKQCTMAELTHHGRKPLESALRECYQHEVAV